MEIGRLARGHPNPWPALGFWTGNTSPSTFTLLPQSAADNRNRWTFPSKAPRCCTSSPVSFPSRIGGSSFALKPSQIKTALNHTARKSFSTDALDWITVALSIGRNIFLTSLTKNTITNNLLDILCLDVATVSRIEANRHISLTDPIIHVHKLAAGKFLWNNHHALVKLHRTISRL